MPIGKGEYLKMLTSAMTPMRSAPVSKELDGSSPPSVFIGSYEYPKVYAGPMIAPVHGDTSLMDMPESWVRDRIPQEEIIRYRLGLVRGKKRVSVSDLNSRFIEQLQEIALSGGSIESEAKFAEVPAGFSFSEEHAPFGPSAQIEHLDIESIKWNRDLERVFYDTDLGATDAVCSLHRQGVPFSGIQKAFSAGTMGYRRGRRLVPTRWSITACDTAIGNHLLREVKRYNPIDTWRVHQFSSLHNRYAVILTPTGWQYEWTEAFLHVLGNEELVFSDHEVKNARSGYSPLGGCYYSCKMAVLEALAEERKQAGAIILREAAEGYVPLGVFNVRENVRQAMHQPGNEFEDIRSALSYVSESMSLPMQRFMSAGTILSDITRKRQTSLAEFAR